VVYDPKNYFEAITYCRDNGGNLLDLSLPHVMKQLYFEQFVCMNGFHMMHISFFHAGYRIKNNVAIFPNGDSRPLLDKERVFDAPNEIEVLARVINSYDNLFLFKTDFKLNRQIRAQFMCIYATPNDAKTNETPTNTPTEEQTEVSTNARKKRNMSDEVIIKNQDNASAAKKLGVCSDQLHFPGIGKVDVVDRRLSFDEAVEDCRKRDLELVTMDSARTIHHASHLLNKCVSSDGNDTAEVDRHLSFWHTGLRIRNGKSSWRGGHPFDEHEIDEYFDNARFSECDDVHLVPQHRKLYAFDCDFSNKSIGGASFLCGPARGHNSVGDNITTNPISSLSSSGLLITTSLFGVLFFVTLIVMTVRFFLRWRRAGSGDFANRTHELQVPTVFYGPGESANINNNKGEKAEKLQINKF